MRMKTPTTTPTMMMISSCWPVRKPAPLSPPPESTSVNQKNAHLYMVYLIIIAHPMQEI